MPQVDECFGLAASLRLNLAAVRLGCFYFRTPATRQFEL